ncbi:MAG: YdcF family protein [Nitrospiraceae bacterium]
MDFSPFWFGLYKFVKYAVYPYTWLVFLLGLLCLLVLGRMSAWRLFWVRILTITALLFVCFLGNPLVARVLMASLEEQYPPFNPATVKRFDTIVVLGGGINPKGTLRPTDVLSHLGIERTMCGADLLRRGYAPQLLFSGGSAAIFEEGPLEGVAMQQLAIRLGVPEEATAVEVRSRNTYEGALEVGRLVGGKSVLLVTSASHMPRALGLFKKQGIDTTPSPCGYESRHRSTVMDVTVFDFLPQSHALDISTNAISEIVGIAVYRAIGKL